MTLPTDSPTTRDRSSDRVREEDRLGQDVSVAEGLRLDDVAVRVGACRIEKASAMVETGRVAALSGPVGSGKSTLLRAILGVQAITTGRVLMNNRDQTFASPDVRNLAWVPQGGGLLPGHTVREQLEYPLVAHDEPIVGVDETAEKWRIARLLHRHPTNLSGGEKQLVALARATIRKPAGLLLDEPYSALSDEQRRNAMNCLAKWRDSNRAVWVVHATHRPEEIVDASVIWAIDGSRLVARPCT